MESEGLFASEPPYRNRKDGNFSGRGRGGGRGERWDRGSGRGERWDRGVWRPRRGGGSSRGSYSRRGRPDQSADDNGGGRSDRRFAPYSNPRNDRGGHQNTVFNRLGRSGGESGGGGGAGVFSRLSGMTGPQKQSSWHKVTVCGVAEQNEREEEWVLQQLTSAVPFVPVQTHNLGDKLMFFVEDIRVADELKGIAQISVAGREPLDIIVRPSPPPRLHRGGDRDQSRGTREDGVSGGFGDGGGGGWRSGRGRLSAPFDGDAKMEEDPKTVVLGVLAKRFDESTQSLDLSDMFHDETLRHGGVKGDMFDHTFVSSVFQLVGEHCPNLKGLDLSSNRLKYLDAYTDIASKCPSLEFLNLSDNNLHDVEELKKVAVGTVTTLLLENIPFMQRPSADVTAFIRKCFPNLQMLNSQQLPKPVKFDLPIQSGEMPSIKNSYLGGDEVRKVVVAFLEQFYMMFDDLSDLSRDKLLEAYSNEAVFSLAVNNSPLGSRGSSLQSYVNCERNYLYVKDLGKRLSALKRGRIDIVQLLKNLPRTKHIPSTFTVDVVRTTAAFNPFLASYVIGTSSARQPSTTAFVLYGAYVEVEGRRPPESWAIRSFTRMFVITTVGGTGVSIINDQMMVRNASAKVVKLVMQELPQLVQEASMQPSTSAAATDVSMMPDTLQQAAVQRLSMETRMNLHWSAKCLEENQWDYNKALAAFNFLMTQSKVPPEAFI